VASFRALMQTMLEVIQRRRIVIGMPVWVARIMAGVLDLVQFVSFGLVPNAILTRDQLRNLARDNVVDEGARGFDALGIVPTAMDSVLPEYLWKFRPAGQYAELMKSGRRLRP